MCLAAVVYVPADDLSVAESAHPQFGGFGGQGYNQGYDGYNQGGYGNQGYNQGYNQGGFGGGGGGHHHHHHHGQGRGHGGGGFGQQGFGFNG